MSREPTRLIIRGPRPPQPPGFDKSLRAHYEVSNFRPKIIFWVFATFFPALGLVALAAWLLLGALAPQTAREAPVPPAARFGGPPLQPSAQHPALPWQDLLALRRHVQQTLDSYATLPGDPQHARIPIARAETLLLQKHLLTSWPVTNTLPYTKDAAETSAPSAATRGSDGAGGKGAPE